MKAMSTYLNQTGAGDYNLPTLIGDKIAISTKKNNPNWSFQSRTKLAWFPQRTVDFQGGSSPAVTSYSPQPDNQAFHNYKYSQNKHERFYLPSSVTKVRKQVPIQYMN